MTNARRMGSPAGGHAVRVSGAVGTGVVDALRDCDAVGVVDREEDTTDADRLGYDVAVVEWQDVDDDGIEATQLPCVAVGPADAVTEAMAAGVSAFVPETTPTVVADRAVELARLGDGSTHADAANTETTDTINTDVTGSDEVTDTDAINTDATGSDEVTDTDTINTDATGSDEVTDTDTINTDATGSDAMNTDTTDDASSRLTLERDRFQTLFDAFPEPVIAYRFEKNTTRIHRANTAFGRTFDVDPDEIRGERVGRVVVPESELSEAKRIDEQIREYESVAREVTRSAADGRRRFRLQNVPRADDETIDGFAIYADVTETKRRQRELKRRNERLDEFASVVSHDLRNPLSVADGNVELAVSMTDDQAVADRLTRAADAIERMGTLIEDLLTVARRGADVECVEPVDLEELAPVAWQTAATGPVSLSLADPPVVEADRGRLQQLLENLFRNAADHAVAGDADDPDVTVAVGACPDGFYVADDGVGFELADPSAAFEAGVTTADDGTGFGLRIVHEIAEAHGWRVTATDGADGGARFEIRGVDRPEE